MRFDRESERKHFSGENVKIDFDSEAQTRCRDTHRLNLSNVFESRLGAGRIIEDVATDLSVFGETADDRLTFPAFVERCTQFAQIDLLLLAVRIGEATCVGHTLRIG